MRCPIRNTPEQGLASIGETLPGLNHRVRVQGQRSDALLDQPLGEIRVVAWALTADADILALLATGTDRPLDHRLDRWIALVEVCGE